MDSFEFNKVLGALLGALTLLVGVIVFSDILFQDHAPEVPGLLVEVPEEGVVEEAVFVTPLPVLLASASVEDGESFVRACASCHNFGAGEPNKVGPALHGVIGREIAALPDFGYSDALMSRQGEPWDFEHMAGFLEDPRGWAPGTTMGYAGIRRDTDLANVLAYLNSITDTPQPVPTEEEAAVILAEAEAAFAAEQAGDAPVEGDLGDGDPMVQDEGDVVLDEAIETEAGLADDSADVKIDGGAAETPTPPSEIDAITTGEDIAIETDVPSLVDGDEPAEIAPSAPVIDTSSQDGTAAPSVETDAAAPAAVPAQQTVPAVPNAAQPGTLANPTEFPVEDIERSGAEGFSPAAAQPGPSPGVSTEDTLQTDGPAPAVEEEGGQPAMAEDAIEAVTGEDAETARPADPTPAVAPAPAAPTVVIETEPATTPRVIVVPIETD